MEKQHHFLVYLNPLFQSLTLVFFKCCEHLMFHKHAKWSIYSGCLFYIINKSCNKVFQIEHKKNNKWCLLIIKKDLTPNTTEGCDERISFHIEQNYLLVLKWCHLIFISLFSHFLKDNFPGNF